ncbi:MAG TPA: hypothetical protein VEM35_08585, partial [Rhizomicrobium sp.]|nr:hypothetical protein [Rhizomicrobium sp.]
MKTISSRLQRRNFLKLIGAVPAAEIAPAWAATDEVSWLDQSGMMPVKSAARKLEAALAAHGVKLQAISDPSQAKGLLIAAATPNTPLAASFPPPAPGWASPDCLRLVPGEVSGHTALLVSAVDARGFVYGIHELAER